MATIKRRKDCFFGLHNDFHAKPQEGIVIGATLTEADIRTICETMKPDFIQIDCKGHPGYTSYPSKLGNAMPHFAGDPLALWRRITKEYGIGLYMHYSGVYEIKYTGEHPEDSAIAADGTPTTSVRLDGDYMHRVLIPQISELVDNYQIDGLWIDGDCWLARPDYRSETVAKFEADTGISLGGTLPANPGDPYFDEYMEFSREQYRTYLRTYVDILHEKYPDLQICSNWAFSDHMPEAVCANVDFLSGDFNPLHSFNSSRYAGRYLAQQNVPWDLMAWGCRFQSYGTPLTIPKHPIQSMQEAASVISLGGAFQNYVLQYPDGSPNTAHWQTLGSLSDFVRARQPFCFRGKPMPQAAMLVSTYDRFAEMTRSYSRDGCEKLIADTALLCDSGLSLTVVAEHTLEGRYDAYPLIVVPELYKGLRDETVAALRAYVENGGSLCLMGAKTAQFFAEKGFPFAVSPNKEMPDLPNNSDCENGHQGIQYKAGVPYYFTMDGVHFGSVVGAWEVTADGETIGTLHRNMRSAGVPFAKLIGMGKGTLAVIAADIGSQYAEYAQYLHRDMIKRVADALYTPLVKIERACGLLELTCLEKDGRLMIQLVNAGGQHANDTCASEDFLPPVMDITLSIANERQPKRLVLQPEGRELPFTTDGDRTVVTLDRVDIHSIIQVIE